MGYRNYAAALMFAAFAFTAAPVAAQGYAGVLPDESTGSSDDKGALPFMSSQMGKQESGGHANVTGGAKSGDDAALGGFEVDAPGLDDELGDEQATADTAEDMDGDGQPDAPDVTDLYGLGGDTTLSTDEQGAQSSGKTGYMALIGGGDDKAPKTFDGGDDPAPADLYRAIEGGDKNDSERQRLRLQRQLDAARAQHDKEIDAMNAARLRDHQVRAQAEVDRVLTIQQEAMAKVREAQGTATPEDYQLNDGGAPQEISDGTAEAVEGAESELVSDDTGETAE